MRAVNLIPGDQRRGASVGAGKSEGAAYVVLGLVAAIAVLAFLYGHARHQVASRKAQAAALTAKASALSAEATALTPYTSFVKLAEEREQAVDSLVNTRFDWAHSFHELGRVLPRNVTISSLSGQIGAPSAEAAAPAATATEPAAAGSTTAAATGTSTAAESTTTVASATPTGSVPSFTLAGCATSQRAVAIMLQRLRAMDGVSEVTLQSSATAGGSSSGSASCTGHDASFGLTIDFKALPASTEAAAAAVKSAAKASTVSDKSSTGGAK